MRRLLPAALSAAALAPCLAEEPACRREPKSVEIPEMMWRTCMIGHYYKWASHGDPNATGISEHVGCWKRLGWNGNDMMRTALWQDQETMQCSLQIGGFGGGNSTDWATFYNTLMLPPKTKTVCGFRLWEPFLNHWQRHIRLRNFSRLTSLLAGPESTCRGDIMVSGVSIGGSIAEMLAGCANKGMLDRLFGIDPREPRDRLFYTNWTVGEMYTFAPQASSSDVIKNHLNGSKGHCFRGKRFYFKGDALGGFYFKGDALGGVTGSLLYLRHPHLETVEMFRGEDGPTYRVYPCESEETTRDVAHRMPPQLSKSVTDRRKDLMDMRKKKLPHDMLFHKEFLRWFYEAGVLSFDSLNFPVERKGNQLLPSVKLTGRHEAAQAE